VSGRYPHCERAGLDNYLLEWPVTPPGVHWIKAADVERYLASLESKRAQSAKVDVPELFTAEDFQSVTWGDAVCYPRGGRMMADIANAKFAQLLESAPVVYSGPSIFPAQQVWNVNYDESFHTHCARLIGPQPIEREESERLAEDLFHLARRILDVPPRSAHALETFVKHAKALIEKSGGSR
jgi:hypothetical protein